MLPQIWLSALHQLQGHWSYSTVADLQVEKQLLFWCQRHQASSLVNHGSLCSPPKNQTVSGCLSSVQVGVQTDISAKSLKILSTAFSAFLMVHFS